MGKYLLLIASLFILRVSYAKKSAYTPKIEPCACAFKADTSLKTRCAYLIVPENRNQPNGKTIKLPFIYVESNNPDKHKDPVLYTSGGPGGSSLGGVRFIHQRQFIKNRDYIAFEQRGTEYALPCLKCEEVDQAIKEAYRKNLSKDSIVIEATKRCRKRLADQGIDLSAYNTIESAADIEDLRRALHIDSLNLMGISYSGGLMMTVMRNYPQHIRSVILDSALPGFVNYEEDALFTINEAFNKVFSNCERDSTNKVLYGNLKERFQHYFSSINGKAFYMKYLEKDMKDTISIKYSRNELLDILLNKLSSNRDLKHVPRVINDLINGNQQSYLKELFDGIFNSTGHSALGMRYSVYCSEQIAYAKQSVIDKQNNIFPYMANYPFNNVNHPLCGCWKVSPVNASAKTPVYSNLPVLLSAGDTDPWCGAYYNDLVHHYMPNSQRLLFINRTHGPALNTREGDILIAAFLEHPFQQIKPDGKTVIIY